MSEAEVVAPPTETPVGETEKENDTQNVNAEKDTGSKRKRAEAGMTEEDEEDRSTTKKANLVVGENTSTEDSNNKIEGMVMEGEKTQEESNRGTNVDPTSSSTGIVPVTSSLPSTFQAPNFPPVRGMAQFNAFAGDVKEIMFCPQELVGRVIGKSGETIKDLQVRAKCRIQINQNLPEGQPREIIIESDAQAKIEEAKSMIKVVMDKGPEGLHSMPLTDNTITMDCAENLVGRVIGKGGDTIRDLQKRTGARIQVDQNYPPGEPRKVQVSGTESQIEFAKKLISCAMEYGPMSVEYAKASIAPQSQGTEFQQEIDCQRAFIARVIGKKGETLKKLEQMTGAKIVIDQDVPEGNQCKITILSTSKENLSHTSGLVIDVMRNGPGRLNMDDNRGPSRGQMGHNYARDPNGGYGGYSNYNSSGPPRGYGHSNMYQNSYNYPSYGGGGAGYGQYSGRHQQSGGYGQQGHPSNYHGQYGAGNMYQQPQNQNPYHGQYSQPPRAPAPAPSSEWIKYETDQGVPYWYSTRTQQTQWENPGV